MIHPTLHAARRRALVRDVPGPILLLGNGVRARNLPMNELPFRQDSTFLYYTGCALPGAAALLQDGRCELFLPAPEPDDHLWHGAVTPLEDLASRYGVDAIQDANTLEARLEGLSPSTLAVADSSVCARFSELLGLPLVFGREHGTSELVQAVIAHRRVKAPEEVAEHERAARHTEAAFEAVLRATRPGAHERSLAALFTGVLAARGCSLAYDVILTQAGEVLHNHRHDAPLSAGRLLLLDGGGEVESGYGVDITRTWPVDGRFTPRQRAAYEAVLEAQLQAIVRCRPGVRYREVHDTACLVLARWLVDEGLLRGTPEDAVARGSHAVFFPHGVGHLLGLDVHDLENFGDLPAYPPGQGRPEPFGTRYLRLDLPLEPGWLVTVEPGFYVAPGILGDPTLRERFRQDVDWERAESWLGLGGVRIEDDVLVTEGAPQVLTTVPKTVDALEALIGQGPTAEERLCTG